MSDFNNQYNNKNFHKQPFQDKEFNHMSEVEHQRAEELRKKRSLNDKRQAKSIFHTIIDALFSLLS